MSRSTRWYRSPVLVCAIALGVLFAIALPSGAILPGSTFEGNDGNLIVNTTGKTDWVNAPNRVRGDDLASGTSDNSFGQGTKEDDANVTVVTGSIPPQKSDLTRFYVASEFANSSNFLYLAWERTNVLGSANMDFEINKLAQPNLTTTGAKTLNRSPGDLLVTFDFTNGGGNPVLGLLRWTTAANGVAGDCFSANALPCWGINPTEDALDGVNDNRLNLSSAGFAEGAVNTGTVAEPIAGGNLAGLTFGEAAINLTAAGVFPAGTCTAFGSAFLKSRASASFPAEVKDFVAPQPVNITNCGTLIIKKVTNPSPDPADPDTLFPFSVAGPTAGLPKTFSLSNGQTNSTQVFAGTTYSAEETSVPANWQFTTASCSNSSGTLSGRTISGISVGASETVTCTFTNTLRTGAIQVTKTRKHAAAGSGDHPQAGVNFTVNGVTKATDANGVACFDGLLFGAYTVHETVPTGYHVKTGDQDQSVTVDNSASCADATYVGETVAVHNIPLTDITVSVNSQVDGGTASTIACTNGGPSGSTGANGDGSATKVDLEPGTYVCTVVVDP